MSLSMTFPLRIREAASDEHPLARLALHGASTLSDAELIMLLLGNNDQPQTQQMLTDVGGLTGLQRLSIDELQQLPGIGTMRAARIKAALELTRRMVLSGFEDRFQIRAPSDAAQLMLIEMSHLDQEHLRVICLGEVFKEAIRLNSAAIILVHNHPSGDPAPSSDDIQVTRDVVAAGKLLDVDLLDHLIIGQGQWVSLRERGLGFH